MDILISEELDAPSIRRLCDKYKVVSDGALWKDPAKLKQAIAEARTIMVRNQTQLTADVLGAAPKLIGIGRVGVGLDNIDMAAANGKGIVVIAPLDANATSVAELAFGFILALARRIPRADRSTKSGGWDRKNCTGAEVDGKTVAICGFGRIGRKVAMYARAFGMKAIAYDPFVKQDSPALLETGATLAGSLEEALAAADFISVHSPLTPETRHMFNRSLLAKVKPGACLINTARGGVVDEAALTEALRSGHLGGAALDVREKEPPVLGELEKMENVILAPHIAAFTLEAQTRTYEAVAGDIDRLLSGEPAKNFVNRPKPEARG
ncbi:MAG TPA: hydroxyacid dehydrogenase [Verrucomicrobiae bacterium]|nr:hydroxyacid dehydrogenase [Verrucomicrobiae bacterium]